MIDLPMHARGRNLPTIRLRQEELPEVRGWVVNGKHYLVVKVEMVGKHNTKSVGADDPTDIGKIEGEFQVLSVKALGDTPVDAKSLEREDMERVVADVRSGKMK